MSVSESKLAISIRDALSGSLDIREAWAAAHPLLLRLVPADHAAVGLSAPGQPGQFEWIVADMPPAFFASYGAVAQHDFVLHSVLEQPNRVLRDSEMVPRPVLESNPMYGLARDVGTPLEQVMSVLLHADGDWQSGLSLYRARRRPFSGHESRVLQQLVPALSNAVRNWRRFSEVSQRSADLEAVWSLHDQAVVVFAPPGREVLRTRSADVLLKRWFGPSRGVPPQLTKQVRHWCSRPGREAVPLGKRWKRASATLLVDAYWLDPARLAVTFRENVEAPLELRSLTPREQQVLGRLLEGWDNTMIADELGCAETTVKKHVYRVFNKLGADRRPQLMARAQRANWTAHLTRH